ncbi:MAG: gliding motility-associated-like protein [Patiriisocius sp.]|jgi:gliding motility-associated-like protein
MVRRLLLAAFFIFSFTLFHAQYTIDGAFEASPAITCGGSFLDDPSGGPYGTGSFEYTICPDNPGDGIVLDFALFNLTSITGPNSDYLSVFDGDNTGTNSLGDYTGNSLFGLTVSATITNLTGCLTMVLTNNTGNSSNLAGWEALISCETPCSTPTINANITDPTPINSGMTVSTCMGNEVSFSSAGSTADPGFSIDHYEWNFNDGTPILSTTNLNVTHVFTEPGEYLVGASVVDNNGCQSLNLNPLQVLVSTNPAVDLVFEPTVCFGETLDMSGTAEGVTWTSLPPQVVSGETFLPDDAGSTYTTTLTFDFFEPGAILTDCADLLGIFVNMEHSYLGDLTMSITCPDNTTVQLQEQGGGGTYLGEALDVFPVTPDPGVGYEYGWQPGLMNGPLDDPANATSITFVDASGVTQTQNIVTPGYYEPAQDLCDLVGCPLNGSWTFNVTDNIGADNGTIFYWGIDFNPVLFPDVTTFTPTVGEDVDSTWWSGPISSTIIDQGNTITFLPDAPGFFDFTYNTMNSFGCGYDTTITVEIYEMDDIQAWPDQVVDCLDPTQVGVDIIGGLATDYDFIWTPDEYIANPTLQNPNVTGINGTTQFDVTVFVEGHPACFKTDQLTIEVPGELIIDSDTAVCNMDPYQLNAYAVGTGQWTIPAGLTISGNGDPYFDPNAVITPSVPGYYTLTWSDIDGLSCPNTKDVTISFFDGIDITPIVTDVFCNGDCNGEVSLSGIGGIVAADYTYSFTNVDPLNVAGNTAILLCPGPYSVTLTDDNGCSWPGSYFIGEPPVPVIDSVLAVREECRDFCNGSITVLSDEAVTYSYDGGDIYIPSSSKNDFCPGNYSVFIEDANGCIGGPVNAFIGSPTPPEASFIADPIPADILHPAITFNNTSYGDELSEWLFNTPEPFGTSDETNPVFNFPPNPGTYPVQLTITDSIGCQDVIEKNVLINDVLQVFIPTSFTPNEDGLNDLFSPIGTDIDPAYYTFVVYSRWGDEVYKSTTYPHTWNGSLNNKKEYYMPDGYYTWSLVTKSMTTSSKVEMNGAIMILR